MKCPYSAWPWCNGGTLGPGSSEERLTIFDNANHYICSNCKTQWKVVTHARIDIKDQPVEKTIKVSGYSFRPTPTGYDVEGQPIRIQPSVMGDYFLVIHNETLEFRKADTLGGCVYAAESMGWIQKSVCKICGNQEHSGRCYPAYTRDDVPTPAQLRLLRLRTLADKNTARLCNCKNLIRKLHTWAHAAG